MRVKRRADLPEPEIVEAGVHARGLLVGMNDRSQLCREGEG